MSDTRGWPRVEVAPDEDRYTTEALRAMIEWTERREREQARDTPPFQTDRVADYILIGLMAVAGVALIVLAFVWGGNA